MADNYKDTAYRMYDCSGILYQNKQWFNANYLAGYVLECYCKLLLTYSLSCGERISQSSARGYGHNLETMKQDIDIISLCGGSASAYCVDFLTECSTIQSHWNPNIRYESNGHILGEEYTANNINEEKENLMELILKMEVDGVI